MCTYGVHEDVDERDGAHEDEARVPGPLDVHVRRAERDAGLGEEAVVGGDVEHLPGVPGHALDPDLVAGLGEPDELVHGARRHVHHHGALHLRHGRRHLVRHPGRAAAEEVEVQRRRPAEVALLPGHPAHGQVQRRHGHGRHRRHLRERPAEVLGRDARHPVQLQVGRRQASFRDVQYRNTRRVKRTDQTGEDVAAGNSASWLVNS